MGWDTRVTAKEAFCLRSYRPPCPEHSNCSAEAGFPLWGLSRAGRTGLHRAEEDPEHLPHFGISSQYFYLIGLLVTSDHAHSLYEGMAWVVHSSLDALVQGVTIGSHLVPELGIDGRGEALGHAVVVLA